MKLRALLAVVALLAAAAPVARAGAPALSARSAILIESTTGRVLYARAAERPREIASTTKMMTVLLALEHDPLTKVVSVPSYRIGALESNIALRRGERLTIADLIRAALLPSANDAAYTLGVRTSGSLSRFVHLMNVRARQLGLHHTHYETPVGLDTRGNYSSAHDLVRLARVLRSHPFARKTMDESRAVLHSGSHVRVVFNRDDLVNRVPWVNGVKTGHTTHAGYVLVSSARRNGMTLYSAVLGTPSEGQRDADALALLSYGYRTFGFTTALRRAATVARSTVKDKAGLTIPLLAGRGVRSLVRRGTRVTRVVDAPRQLKGPLPRGAVVGHVVLRAGGRRIARVPLLTGRSVPAVSVLTVAFRRGRGPAIVVGILALVALAVVAESRRRRARRRRERRRRRREVETA